MIEPNEIKERIVNLVGQKNPEIGIICGSGLSQITDIIEDVVSIAYSEILDFPVPSVKGHFGVLSFGMISGRQVICFSGRFHRYEGRDWGTIALPITLMALYGVKTVILTNSSGSLRECNFKVGDIAMITDHISFPILAGDSPLTGGSNFIPLNKAYLRLLPELLKVKEEMKIPTSIKEAVYVNVGGPSYETPAEVRFLRMIGGDIVGMSTIPEVIVAASLDIKVLALSLVTNICLDKEGESFQYTTHQQVLEEANKNAVNIISLIVGITKNL